MEEKLNKRDIGRQKQWRERRNKREKKTIETRERVREYEKEKRGSGESK